MPSATRPRLPRARSSPRSCSTSSWTRRGPPAGSAPSGYLPSDPGAPNEHAAEGLLLFNVGRLFERGLRMGTGQADAKAYAHQLRDLIVDGRSEPSFVVSQELPLSEAPDAYARFDKREPGYSKVLLHPHTDLPA